METKIQALVDAIKGLLPYVEAARLREESQVAAGETNRMPVRQAIRKAREAMENA